MRKRANLCRIFLLILIVNVPILKVQAEFAWYNIIKYVNILSEAMNIDNPYA